MTNGFGHEAYEVEEPRRGTGKARNRKPEKPARRVELAVKTETAPAREREPRRS